MARFFHPLIRLLASGTHRELVGQIQYIKAENEILRSRLARRVTVAPAKRVRLVRLGLLVGAAIIHLVTIATPRTFANWVRREKRGIQPKQAGRPHIAEDIEAVVLRIARETGWGYTRILGELRKLGIHKVSRGTVVNILRRNGLDPGPKRGEGTWADFLQIHTHTLWACDFLSKKVWTLRGPL